MHRARGRLGPGDPAPAEVDGLPGNQPGPGRGQDPRAFTGTYGEYLVGKVSKVFPQLRQDVL